MNRICLERENGHYFVMMIQDTLFNIARIIFRKTLILSGYDPFLVFKYGTKGFNKHPKLIRYHVQEHIMEDSTPYRVALLVCNIFYVIGLIYLAVNVVIAIYVIIMYDKVQFDKLCAESDSSIWCIVLRDAHQRVIWTPGLLNLYFSMFLQAILGRFYCAGRDRTPDLSEIRSLFDRERELERLRYCISERLRWFKTSILAQRTNLLDTLKHIRHELGSGKDRKDYAYHSQVIGKNLIRIDEFIENPDLVIPREFDLIGWHKLKVEFTKIALAIASIYLICLFISSKLISILFHRIKCKLKLSCQGEITLTNGEYKDFILINLCIYYTVIMHLGFSIILTVAHYCHNELIDGLRKLIQKTILNLDSLNEASVTQVDAVGNHSNQFENSIASNMISFDALIRSLVYQMEIERISYGLSICIKVPIISATLGPLALLILLPCNLLSILPEFVAILFIATWIASNLNAAQCSIAAAKIKKSERLSWYLVARNKFREHSNESRVHIFEESSSMLWRRLVFGYSQSKQLYSPHPFGMDVDFHFMLESNFYIISAILLVENLFMSSNQA